MKKNKKNQGTTLIEILLYLTISGAVLFAIMSFSLQIIGISKKTSDMQEIQAGMDFLSNRLTSTIQSATGVNSSTSIFESNTGKISLNVSDAEKSPTLLYLDSENVYIKEGMEGPTKINSDFVKCTQLKFIEIFTPKIPTQIIVDMNCEPINSDLAVLNQSTTLHTSISLRQ